ncbi:MAG: hypothetical protein NVSMB2_01140 [Chloroflexota bacterium]
MWHVETFNSRGRPGEMQAVLRRALVYWRRRGFTVRIFETQYSLGARQFWLCTQLDAVGEFERWPAMATAEPEGLAIMTDLLSLAEGMTASLVAELEV